MKKSVLILSVTAAVAALGGCAGMNESMSQGGDSFATKSFQTIIANDFVSVGQATTDRLKQTPAQAACSKADFEGKPLDAATEKKLNEAALAAVVYPADGKYLGDWKEGLALAKNGKGMQSSDKPGSVNGGNCLACHVMVANDESQGNIGPSLYHYGKLRGDSEAILKYTWARLYDSVAFNACSFMPPFGASHILTEKQMKDAMALLLDPNSPVNK